MTVAPIAAALVSRYDWRFAQLSIGLAVWALLLPAALLVRRPPAKPSGRGQQGDAEITACELADLRDTIPYEVLCDIAARVPRVLVDAGNRLPGVPRTDAFAQLRYGGEIGMHYGATAQYVSAVAVNDVNSVFAAGYAVFGANAGYGSRLASGNWNVFVRINNLFDRHYVGSVIVDDANHGYFESAAPFSVLVGGALLGELLTCSLLTMSALGATERATSSTCDFSES